MGRPIYSCSVESIKKSIQTKEDLVKYCIDSSRTLIYMGESLKLEGLPKRNKKMEFSVFEDKFLKKVREIGLKELIDKNEGWFNELSLREFENIYNGNKAPTPDSNPDKRYVFAYCFLSSHFPEIYKPLPIYEMELSMFEIHEDVGSFPPEGHPNDPTQIRFFIRVLNDFIGRENNRLTKWFNDNFKITLFEKDLGLPSVGIEGFHEIIPGIVLEEEVVIKPTNKNFIAKYGQTEWGEKIMNHIENSAQEEKVSTIEIAKKWEGRIYRKYRLLINNYWGDELKDILTESNKKDFESAAYW